MKWLCVDYGKKRVGIAISDAQGAFAFAHATFANDDGLVERLRGLVEREKVASVVVGDTLSHGGARNAVSDAADAFCASLQKAAGVPVKRAYEAFSSVEANRYAPDDRHDDAAAAAVILQRFLDMLPKGVK